MKFNKDKIIIYIYMKFDKDKIIFIHIPRTAENEFYIVSAAPLVCSFNPLKKYNFLD